MDSEEMDDFHSEMKIEIFENCVEEYIEEQQLIGEEESSGGALIDCGESFVVKQEETQRAVKSPSLLDLLLTKVKPCSVLLDFRAVSNYLSQQRANKTKRGRKSRAVIGRGKKSRAVISRGRKSHAVIGRNKSKKPAPCQFNAEPDFVAMDVCQEVMPLHELQDSVSCEVAAIESKQDPLCVENDSQAVQGRLDSLAVPKEEVETLSDPPDQDLEGEVPDIFGSPQDFTLTQNLLPVDQDDNVSSAPTSANSSSQDASAVPFFDVITIKTISEIKNKKTLNIPFKCLSIDESPQFIKSLVTKSINRPRNVPVKKVGRPRGKFVARQNTSDSESNGGTKKYPNIISSRRNVMCSESSKDASKEVTNSKTNILRPKRKNLEVRNVDLEFQEMQFLSETGEVAKKTNRKAVKKIDKKTKCNEIIDITKEKTQKVKTPKNKNGKLKKRVCRKKLITEKVVRSKYLCPTCGKVVSDRKNYQKHLVSHSDLRPFVCHDCGKCFKLRAYVLQHIRIVHLLDKKYLCKFCKKGFFTSTTLSQHISCLHFNERKFKCSSCSKNFGRKQSLVTHLKYCKMYNAKGFDLKCKFENCNKLFSSKQTLNKHVSTVHNNVRKQVCEICEKKFQSKYHLTRHIQTVHKLGTQFTCKLCKYYSNNVNKLKAHVKSQHGITDLSKDCIAPLKTRNFQCSYCGKNFGRKEHLSNHILNVHLQNNKRKCRKCGERFHLKSELKQHMILKHKETSVFKCVKCSKEYNNVGALVYHEVNIHGLPKNYGTHVCNICKQRINIYNIVLHHREKHLKYICDFCNNTFEGIKKITTHIRRNHIHVQSVEAKTENLQAK